MLSPGLIIFNMLVCEVKNLEEVEVTPFLFVDICSSWVERSLHVEFQLIPGRAGGCWIFQN
jgi:hypothetical protein